MKFRLAIAFVAALLAGPVLAQSPETIKQAAATGVSSPSATRSSTT